MPSLFRALFYRLPQNAWRSLNGYKSLLYLLAAGLTYLAVVSRFDLRWYLTGQNPTLQSLAWPAVALGGLLPIIVPLVLFIAAGQNTKITNLAGALGQAALLGWLFSAVLKTFTGRLSPGQFVVSNATSFGGFRFGFLRGGIFWGWPSTHTTVACAMAAALVALYPKNRLVRILAPLYALYVGLGVSITIHWFSDFLAGAVIGALVGLAVGRSFRERAGRT